MFDTIYEWYVNKQWVRILYGIGFFAAWVVWAAGSVSSGQVTWLVFGWLPAFFWPIGLVAWAVINYMWIWERVAPLFGL
jgi:hypothetical protein